MTFLKKLGQILAKVAGIAMGIGPIIVPFLGSGKAGQLTATTVNDLTLVGQAVLTIETAMQGQAGTAKLAAVIPLVGNIIRTSELVAGKKIANEALFTQSVQEFAQATVDLLNAIHPDEAKQG
jgi:hypothetical protein